MSLSRKWILWLLTTTPPANSSFPSGGKAPPLPNLRAKPLKAHPCAEHSFVVCGHARGNWGRGSTLHINPFNGWPFPFAPFPRYRPNQRELGDSVAAGEIVHLALPLIALCPSVEGQTGRQKAGIGPPRHFHR